MNTLFGENSPRWICLTTADYYDYCKGESKWNTLRGINNPELPGTCTCVKTISPTGDEQIVPTILDAAELSGVCMSSIFRGWKHDKKYTHRSGWSFERIKASERRKRRHGSMLIARSPDGIVHDCASLHEAERLSGIRHNNIAIGLRKHRGIFRARNSWMFAEADNEHVHLLAQR